MPSGPRMPNCAAQLVAPLPSNKVRGVLVEAVQSLTEVPGVKYAVWGTLALNIFYFWCAAIDWPAVRHRARPAQGASLPTRGPMYGARRYTIEGLTHMGRDLGILSPVEFAVSCEAKQDMFRQVALIPRSPSLSLRLSLSLALIPTRTRRLPSRSATR